MLSTKFNPLDYANKLKEAGLEPKVAEVIAMQQSFFLQEGIIDHLATKEDLKDAIKDLRYELKNDISQVKNEIKDLKTELQNFIIKAVVSTMGILGSLQTLFHFMK